MRCAVHVRTHTAFDTDFLETIICKEITTCEHGPSICAVKFTVDRHNAAVYAALPARTPQIRVSSVSVFCLGFFAVHTQAPISCATAAASSGLPGTWRSRRSPIAASGGSGTSTDASQRARRFGPGTRLRERAMARRASERPRTRRLRATLRLRAPPQQGPFCPREEASCHFDAVVRKKPATFDLMVVGT